MLEKRLYTPERFNSSFVRRPHDPTRAAFMRKKAPESGNSPEKMLYTTKQSPIEPVSKQTLSKIRSMKKDSSFGPSDAYSEQFSKYKSDTKDGHTFLELDPREQKKLYDVLYRLLTHEPNSNKIYDAIGRDGLLKIMEKCSPNTFRQLVETRKEVEDLNEGKGYVVIRNTGVDFASSEPELAKLITITLASVYGFPTRHDGTEIAWPIQEKPNTVQEKPNATGSSTLRFGGGSGEAPFHTDTSYFPEPEDTFVLTCLKPAKQGGVNQLVDAWELAKQIKEERPEVYSILTNTQFAFRVPTMFTELKRHDIEEIAHAPIISPTKGIRYRHDVLQLTKLSPEQLKAVEVFEQYLSNAPTSEYLLKPGEGIIMNNRRILHARTFHNDKDRLLIRVRMSKE
jgi:alpha-ketoglutarate-dependent taurine dioxygenase